MRVFVNAFFAVWGRNHVRYRNAVCQALLPDQLRNGANAPDSKQTNQNLGPDFLIFSEIEFFWKIWCIKRVPVDSLNSLLNFTKGFEHKSWLSVPSPPPRPATQRRQRSGFQTNKAKSRARFFWKIWNWVFGLTWLHKGSQKVQNTYASTKFMTHGHEFHDFGSKKHQQSLLTHFSLLKYHIDR